MPKGYPDSPDVKQKKAQKALAVIERKLAALKTRLAFEENPPTIKHCSACNTDKSIECFNKNKKFTDGFFCWCKDCAHAKKRFWHNEHKDSENAKAKIYGREHAEEIRANRLRREAEHPGAENERAKEWQKAHAEELRLKRLSIEWRTKAREGVQKMARSQSRKK